MVEQSAQHPSTWFSVRVLSDNAIIKLQPTAMKLAQEEQPSEIRNKSASPKSSQKSSREEQPSPILMNYSTPESRLRSGSYDSTEGRPRSGSIDTSHAHSLCLGAEVVIRATDNVIQVQPLATFIFQIFPFLLLNEYFVSLSMDLQRTPHLVGQIGYVHEVPVHPATWFKVRFNDGSLHTFRPSALRLSSVPEEEMVESTSYGTINATKRREREAPIVKRAPAVRPSNFATISSGSDFEMRSGATVRIVNGRWCGQIANVLHSSNGWVQLTTNLGDIAKRATDLQLIMPSSQRTDSSVRMATAIRPARLHKSNRFGRADDEDGDLSCGVDFLGQTPEPCTDNDENDDEEDSEDLEEIPDIWKSLDLPMIKPAKVKARRAHIKRFVNKQAAKLKSRNRPNLKYWLERIRGTKESPIEKSRPDCCPVCKTEKWTGGRYCWNATCTASPAFSKHGPLTSRSRQQLLPSFNLKSPSDAKKSTLTSVPESQFATADISSVKRLVYSSLSSVGLIQNSELSVFPDSTSEAYSVAGSHTLDDDMLGMRKRPREDSLSLTDCEVHTPERNLNTDNLTADQAAIEIEYLHCDGSCI